MKFKSLIVCIVFFGNQYVTAQAQTDTIPFTFSEQNNLIIEAVINGVDSVNLMFHTDARGVTLIQASTEAMTSLDWGATGTATSWGGAHSSRISEHNQLNIGTLVWNDLVMFEDQLSGPGTDGKFGPDLFLGKVIEVNFDLSVLVLSNSLKEDLSAYYQCPLFTEDGSMFIEGKCSIGESITHRFLLHSGYGGTILFDDEFAKQKNLNKAIEITSEQSLRDSFGNVILTKKGTLPLFTIGNLLFQDMTVGFFDGSVGQQRLSIIGSGLLKRMNFIIDAEREHIYVVKNSL